MLFEYHPPVSPWIVTLYKDNDIVVVNKQSGLLSVPGKSPQHKDSIVTRLLQNSDFVESVHRLDMATSGVMVIALTKAAERELKRQFRERETKKCYIAHVFGHPPRELGSIDLPIICDWPNRPKQKICYENGKQALTNYRVIRRLPNNTSVMELIPITGRSHQLRLHMQALGYPILGDKFYAPPDIKNLANRLLLHAQSLTITHPTKGNTMTFYCNADF